jgi:hypothetical protein
VNFILDNIKIIVSIIATFIGFFASLKINFTSTEKIIRGKYSHFKTIRKEYSDDKLNGYFALQQYFKTNFSVDEMEHIINSPNAYRIFLYIKVAKGKYIFKDNQFISIVTRKDYILPGIGYFIFCFSFIPQIMYANIIIPIIGLYSYIVILIVNISISIPILVNCFISINEIACSLELGKLSNTNNNNKKLHIRKKKRLLYINKKFMLQM